jgi:hypothetical protein
MTGGQFPGPGPERMLDRIGEMSPMGLLWTFMGQSPAYCHFAGLVEMVGGGLLFYRRTTMLGALVVVAAMANVVALNFTHDVPVKIFSSHLLLIAGFLLIPDLRRLADVFLFDRPARRAFTSRTIERIYVVVKPIAIAAIVIGGDVVIALFAEPLVGGDPADLAGTWEVDGFTREGQDHPPLFTDGARWRFLAVDRRGAATVRFADETTDRFVIRADPASHEVRFRRGFRAPGAGELKYTFFDPDHVTMDGQFDGSDLRMSLHRHEGWRLQTRGFHWVNEMPFNR